jgi:allantoin racemase
MKEITEKPVVGIAEASITIATMVGHKFSIVSTSRDLYSQSRGSGDQVYLQDALASVRASEGDVSACSTEEKYLQAARLAIEEDMAEVIVRGWRIWARGWSDNLASLC